MAPKPKFSTAPRPPALTAEEAAFIDRGRGKDQAVAPPAGGPRHRLSIDLPKRLHSRFKAACAMADTKMTTEIIALIEQRTSELEQGKE